MSETQSGARPGAGIARKLVLAFGALLVAFGIASYFALHALLDIHGVLHKVQADGEAVRVALELANAVGDQHAHVAHTMVMRNESHVGRYAKAFARVGALVVEARRVVDSSEEKTLVDEIAGASHDLDRVFHELVLPAARGNAPFQPMEVNDRILDLVLDVQGKADRLVQLSEASIAGYGEHASLVHHAAVRWTLALLAVTILAAAAIGLYLYRSIARPVAALEAGARRLAGGDLDGRIVISAGGELGRLADQFNAMTAALKDHQARLVQVEKFASLGRLAAGVAHEINNPLGVILGYVTLLRRKTAGPIEADLKIVEDEANRCREVVEDLLDLTRVPAPESDHVQLGALCAEIIERVNGALAGKCPAITIQGDAHLVGSARRLRQVVMNLVKNAAEAAGPSGRVSIDIAQTGDHVTVSVSDNGPGIRPEDRARLFEPFFTTKPAGTGLGLAVSRAIARAHGGDLDLRDATASGAVFTLTLPLEARSAA